MKWGFFQFFLVSRDPVVFSVWVVPPGSLCRRSAGEMRSLPCPPGQNAARMCSPGWTRRAPALWQFSCGGLVSFLEQLSIQNTVATRRAADPSGCPDTGCRVLERTRGAAAAKASHCRAWAARRARPALRAAASDSGRGPGIVLVSFLQRSGRSLHHFQ